MMKENFLDKAIAFAENKNITTVENLFTNSNLRTVVTCGSAFRWYNAYGITELQIVYDNLSKEAFNERLLAYVKHRMIDDFDSTSLENCETASDAHKVVNAYLGFTVKYCMRELLIDEARKYYPHITNHYLANYIRIRKLNLSLTDSPEHILEVCKENNLRMSNVTVYGMLMAFGYITPKMYHSISRKREDNPAVHYKRKVALKKKSKMSAEYQAIIDEIESNGSSLYNSDKNIMKACPDIPLESVQGVKIQLHAMS